MPHEDVFDSFKSLQIDVPYKNCPKCGECLRMFKHTKHPGEIIFYCQGCDWNHTVTDVHERQGDQQTSDTEKVYVDDDRMIYVRPDGLRIIQNINRVV